MRIGIDIMGSDSSPEILFNSVIQAARNLSEHSLVAFATAEFTEIPEHPENVSIQICDDFITMKDDPLSAIRLKKKSTMVTGIRQLKENELDAFVSAGNTGALITASALFLEMLPGIDRPALMAVLPSRRGRFVMADVGGRVSVKAEDLVQFAHFGSAYARTIQNIEVPKVGLMNVGVESTKGTSEIRKAYELLSGTIPEYPIEFVGNIEGRHVFEGNVDVLVSDGFSGNVLLKTAEGLSELILDHLEHLQQSSVELDELRMQYVYSSSPGAIVCGVDKVVLKCHGHVTDFAYRDSISQAAELVEKNLIEKISQEL